MKENLILLHGALGDTSAFDFIEKQLASDYEMHKLLFLGHGLNNDSEKSFYISDLVSQLHSFIKQNDLEKPAVFGYSLGGYVALCYALKYPGVIKAIVTLATKFEWSVEIAEKETRFLNPAIILEKVPKYAENLAKIHGEKWMRLLDQVADLMKDIGKNNYLNKLSLSKILIPVQTMVGDLDKQVSTEESIWAAKHLANAKLIILPDAEHPFEKVDQHLLLQRLQEFIKTT